MQSNDQTEIARQIIADAIKTKVALQIVGGNSKSFYGRQPQGTVLNISNHQGIINYHPSELVITARTGTKLSEIEQVLADKGQMLAFEPPHFSSSATLGGTIACGFSGSRRPFTGSARDFVLGCKIINGKAEVLSFGGEVMKNVAGYDVSRLMVGAMGTLGLLLEVSLKVLPKPEMEKTLVFEFNTKNAIEKMTALSLQSLPLSGLCFDGQKLYVRLSGVEKAVLASAKKLGGLALEKSADFWQKNKEHQHSFFHSAENLWRLSVPPACEELSLSGDWFYDWGGALRWLKTTENTQDVFAIAEKMQGHATLFRPQNRQTQVFQPLPPVLKKLNHNLKKAFDPSGVFNPYRMAMDW